MSTTPVRIEPGDPATFPEGWIDLAKVDDTTEAEIRPQQRKDDAEEKAVAVVPKAATELVDLVHRNYELLARMTDLCAANPLLAEMVREEFEGRVGLAIKANDEAFTSICQNLVVLAGGAVNGSEDGFGELPDTQEIQWRINGRPEEQFYSHAPTERDGKKWMRPYKRESKDLAERLGVSWLLDRDPAAAFMECQREEHPRTRPRVTRFSS
ncbi:MAG: hypothetical protein F4X59_14955 [Holophagales bacterium]|nr:hypothetical protein [Holophagales bacterium]MYC11411.1 hypothetical protein [Holophagales bacterium]